MHETFDRLLIAAGRAKLKDLGLTSIGDALGEAPQTVKNWQKRGLSLPGALKAEVAFDCRAAWLLYGTGTAGWPGPSNTPPPATIDLHQALEKLGIALAAVDAGMREALATNLAGWARDGGKGPWQQVVQHLLQATPGKRRDAA